MSPEPENPKDVECPKCKDKHLDRLVALWTHQNQLLWGRLQTIALIQGAVLGGWYALYVEKSKITDKVLATLLVALGVYFSWKLQELIKCDRDVRDRKKSAIRFADKDRPEGQQLFPLTKNEGRMSNAIETMAKVFVAMNGFLLVLCLLYPLYRVSRWLCAGH